MKGRPKITRVQLNDYTDEESTIFGIVTTEPDYKISQLINKKLKITLKNSSTIDLTGSDGLVLNFTRYSYTSVPTETTFNLISNKSDKDYLLKKFKNIDYFFRISSIENKCDVEQLIGALREIDRITAVFRLDPMEIRDKNLVYLTL
jgi:hypothetical protein